MFVEDPEVVIFKIASSRTVFGFNGFARLGVGTKGTGCFEVSVRLLDYGVINSPEIDYMFLVRMDLDFSLTASTMLECIRGDSLFLFVIEQAMRVSVPG